MSGHDLSGVQVHRNSALPASVGALAYTQGQNIYLGPGQDHHLPHESAHVVQQMDGRADGARVVLVRIPRVAHREHDAVARGGALHRDRLVEQIARVEDRDVVRGAHGLDERLDRRRRDPVDELVAADRRGGEVRRDPDRLELLHVDRDRQRELADPERGADAREARVRVDEDRAKPGRGERARRAGRERALAVVRLRRRERDGERRLQRGLERRPDALVARIVAVVVHARFGGRTVAITGLP
jgi:hypothetical protein